MTKWDADYYHPISLWLYDRAISDMLQLMDVDSGATVLDAGCGPGVHSIRAAKAGLRVIAIDISETMLTNARQRVEAAGFLGSVEFHQMDLTQLDYADASFTYVFSWGVVIHIPEAERALDELARITKPGGRLALYLTNRTALDNKMKSFARFVLKKPYAGQQNLPLGVRTWYEKDGGKLCVWQFDVNAIANYLRRKGFRLLKRRTVEFSEIQRHLGGFPRRWLLRINNVAYKLNLPPRFATGNLFVFENG